jgi:hypothetical protein
MVPRSDVRSVVRSVALVVLILLTALVSAGPVSAGIQLVETKKGKLYEAREVIVIGDKMRISLATKEANQTMIFSIPIESVIPEQVYYVWAAQVAATDTAGHVRLGEWCRKHGLFRQAWREYNAAADSDKEMEKKLPVLETEIGEEAATWYFKEAEKLLKAGDTHRARIFAKRVIDDYPQSKEMPRIKGLLELIAEREEFADIQKVEKARAHRVKLQRRELDKELKEIHYAKTMVRNTRMRQFNGSQGRLRWAAYRFRRSLRNLNDMVPFIEAEDLRVSIEAVVKDTERNMVGSFTKLADLRFLGGDMSGALDAAHEVLWFDPDNKAMTDIRKRVLDEGGYDRYRYRHGFYGRSILRRRGFLPPFATPYRTRYGYGIGVGIGQRSHLRREAVKIAPGIAVIRYVP